MVGPKVSEGRRGNGVMVSGGHGGADIEKMHL